MKYDTATPFAASYLIIRKDGKIALVLRSNTSWMDNHYGLPSGKVEQDESFMAAAVREGLEETGININPGKLRFLHAMHRHNEDSDWVDMFFEPSVYEGEVYNAEPHVHSELAWFAANELPENIVPSVRYAIEQIEAGNHYSEFGWEGNPTRIRA